MGSFCLGPMVCDCLCSMCGSSEKVYARVGYVLFASIWLFMGIALLFFGSPLLGGFAYFIGCPEEQGAERDACLGVSGVYRISFVLALFHAIIYVLARIKGEIISRIHEGAWPLKFLFVSLLLIISFFIPNPVFRIYSYFAMVFSFLFLVYETVLLIDLAYSWGGAWIAQDLNNSRSEDSPNCWSILQLTTTIGCFLGGVMILLGLILKYNGFWEMLEILLTFMAGVGYSMITISPIMQGGSMFACSVMFVFSSFMCVSIVLSDPTSGVSTGLFTAEVGIGLCFLLIVLFYVGGTTRSRNVDVDKESEAHIAIAKVGAPVMEIEDELLEEHRFRDAAEITPETEMFHLLMLFASVYYSLLLTSWGSPSLHGVTTSEFAAPMFGLVVKVAAQWVATGLFFWSLIAPYFFTNRDYY